MIFSKGSLEDLYNALAAVRQEFTAVPGEALMTVAQTASARSHAGSRPVQAAGAQAFCGTHRKKASNESIKRHKSCRSRRRQLLLSSRCLLGFLDICEALTSQLRLCHGPWLDARVFSAYKRCVPPLEALAETLALRTSLGNSGCCAYGEAERLEERSGEK